MNADSCLCVHVWFRSRWSVVGCRWSVGGWVHRSPERKRRAQAKAFLRLCLSLRRRASAREAVVGYRVSGSGSRGVRGRRRALLCVPARETVGGGRWLEFTRRSGRPYRSERGVGQGRAWCIDPPRFHAILAPRRGRGARARVIKTQRGPLTLAEKPLCHCTVIGTHAAFAD
jgi:hypothetical protein